MLIFFKHSSRFYNLSVLICLQIRNYPEALYVFLIFFRCRAIWQTWGSCSCKAPSVCGMTAKRDFASSVWSQHKDTFSFTKRCYFSPRELARIQIVPLTISKMLWRYGCSWVIGFVAFTFQILGFLYSLAVQKQFIVYFVHYKEVNNLIIQLIHVSFFRCHRLV